MSEPKAPRERGGSNISSLESDPLVGAQFGPYRIIGRIADGERGEIYFAEAPEIRRKVAVKVLREEYCRDEAALREFHAEIRLIKELQHEGVAEIYDVGWTTDRRVYVVMERLAGETLQDRIDRGPLPFSEAVGIFGQVLQILAVLHGRGVAHRDLRPDRVFLIPREHVPRVKLLGFGVSRLVNLDDLRKRLPKLSASSGGAAVAAHYLSPEQIVNKPVDARSDIFAVGVLLYEALSGRLPFAGLGAVQVLAKQAQGQLPPLPATDPSLGVPPEMGDLIAKATRREPNERFRDAADMLEALSDVADARGVTVSPSSPQLRSVPSPVVRGPAMGAVGPFPSPIGQPSAPGLVSAPYPPAYPGASPIGQPSTQGYATPAPGQAPVATPAGGQSSPPGYAQPVGPAVTPQPGHLQYPNYDPRSASNLNPPSGGFLPTPAMPTSGQAPASSTPMPSAAPPDMPGMTTGSIRGFESPSSGSKTWIGIVVGLAVLGGGGYFLFGGKRAPGDGPAGGAVNAAASQAVVAFSVAEINDRCLPIVRKALDDPKPEMRARAAEIVGILRDQDRIEELARVRVTDTDPKVRAKAAWALGQIGDKKVIGRLQALRGSADPSAQVSLDEALLRLGDEEATTRLRSFLDGRDPALQVRAALVLADAGSRDAIDGLNRAIKNPRIPAPTLFDLRGALARFGDAAAISALRESLKASDPGERVQAAESLLGAGLSDGNEALRYLADDPQSPYRLLAAKVLALPGDPQQEALFMEASFATDGRVRLLAAEGLARSGKSDAAQSRLWALLGDPSPEVVLVAAGGLLEIQARSTEQLREAGQTWAKRGLSDTDSTVRESFARLLVLGEVNQVGPLLERALKDPEPAVVAAAARSLGSLGRVQEVAKLEPKTPLLTAEVGAALLRNGDARGMDFLRLTFLDRREEARLASISAAQLAKEPSLAREALADKSKPIQRAAAFSLATFGEDAGLSVLTTTLKEGGFPALYARLALWELGRPEGDATPVALWAEASTTQRIRLLADVGRLSAVDASTLLRQGLASPDRALRRAAVESIALAESKLGAEADALYAIARRDAAPDIYSAASLALARRASSK